MLPLSHWPREARAGIAGLLTDIDDTLTTEGAVTPEVLQSLAALRDAGLHVIAITGRPVGWSEPFALAWPVDAIVAENGAVALVRGEDGALRKHYQQDAATRAFNYQAMQQVLAHIVAQVPGAHPAQDSAGRETDIAIDHSEFTHLPEARIAEVVALMLGAGMTATVSSIHINGWYGSHDKLAGARWIVPLLFGRPLDEEIDHWAYVGDSTNDECMFQRFTHSIGVANIRRFEAQLRHPPRYVTEGERGVGFAEVARAILDHGV